jgi:hypothetical protein
MIGSLYALNKGFIESYKKYFHDDKILMNNKLKTSYFPKWMYPILFLLIKSIKILRWVKPTNTI